MKGVKNIILDLGGVLLNIDYKRTAAAFKELGVKHFDDYYSQAGADELFEALETGNISNQDFYAAMKQHCVHTTTFEQIQAAWNSILISFRKESISFLTSIKDRYRLYLFSNTNSIHYAAFNEMFTKETGSASLDDYFIKAWYSHLIQYRKPYPETYKYLLEEEGLIAGETLLIDDSVTNIEGAMEAGLQAYLLQPKERIESLVFLHPE